MMFRGKAPKSIEMMENMESGVGSIGGGGGGGEGRSKVELWMGWCSALKDTCLASTCASTCTKVFLVVVNFAFLMSGWLLLGLGVWLHMAREYLFFTILLTDDLLTPVLALDRISTSLILVGSFVIVLSFLGCCGACTDSVCFLTFYAFLLLVTIVLQITLAALAPSLQQKIISDVSRTMLHQIRYEYNSTAKIDNKSLPSRGYKLTKAWDNLQMKLNCCGAQGPIDYSESSWYNHTNFADGTFVPMSCCALLAVKRQNRKSDAQCQVEAIAAILNFPNITSDHYHIRSKGCLSALIEWFKQFEYLGWFLHVIIILQIVDFIYACILLSWLKKSLVDYAWCEEDDFQ